MPTNNRHFKNKVIAYQTVRVTIQSLSATDEFSEGDDCSVVVGDNGVQSENMFSELGVEAILKVLTKRQLSVATRIAKGYSRREIAAADQVIVQAIHQIIVRIRRRILTCISRKSV